MLVTFKSDAYENISFFQDVALSLLSLMGHSGTIPGALIAEEVPAALEKLESRIKKGDKGVMTQDDEEEENNDSVISLATRAVPLINLLKAAEKKHCRVMWK